MPDDYGQNFFTSPTLTVPRPNFRRSSLIIANGGNSFTQSGEAFQTLGTLGSTSLDATGGDPADYLTSMTSGAVSGNQAVVWGSVVFRTASRLVWQALVRPGPVITVARVWAGLWEVAPGTILASDTPGASAHKGFGFRRSTAIPDTNWQAVVSNGAADTVVDTGVAYAASTSYELQVEWEPASYARFSINGSVKATISATLPSGSGLRQGCGVQTLEAVAKQFDCGWIYGEKE